MYAAPAQPTRKQHLSPREPHPSRHHASRTRLVTAQLTPPALLAHTAPRHLARVVALCFFSRADGVEGLGALWHVEKRAFLCSGGVLRIHELLDGPTLRPHKPDSSAIIQLMAHRLFVQLTKDSEALLQIATAEERRLVAELKAAGTARPRKTIWQAAGVHRGETELERNARVRASEIEAVRGSIELLSQDTPRPQLAALEQYTSALCVTTAGVLGALYGGVRGYCRAWLSDVTPSVCKEVAAHVSRRSALGAMQVRIPPPPC